VFSELNYDCSGYCINDFDEDGECDEVDYDDGLGVDEVMSSSIKPIRMIDVLGREHKNHQPGMLLFYIYDDGRVQKKYLSR
jgi:hypothetical protein